MSRANAQNRQNSAINRLTRRKRIIMWVVVAVAVGLIAYGAWLGANISLG